MLWVKVFAWTVKVRRRGAVQDLQTTNARLAFRLQLRRPTRFYSLLFFPLFCFLPLRSVGLLPCYDFESLPPLVVSCRLSFLTLFLGIPVISLPILILSHVSSSS